MKVLLLIFNVNHMSMTLGVMKTLPILENRATHGIMAIKEIMPQLLIKMEVQFEISKEKVP